MSPYLAGDFVFKLSRNHRFLEASMCLPKWAKRVKKPPLASVSEVPSRASARSRVPGKNSLESWTTLNSTHNSKDSSKSTDSASSLTNIREMLSDGPIIFKYRDLSKVTDNFNASRKVGSGVYRGSLQKTDIAIVVETRGGAGRENFVSEIKNLGSVHHANLVRLLGGCINGDQVYLVYDYISGGNLHQCLHSNLSPGFSVLPSWLLRVRVALEISTGLEYLHHHLIRPTVHKHIKSSNILLDTDLHVKIAFFGVAQIRGETGAPEVKLMTQSMEGEIREHINEEVGDRRTPLRGMKRFHSIKFTGTHGYMAPEYVNGGIISSKLDVFAFGVILLELLSGQKAVTFETIPGGNRLRKTLLSEVIISLFAENDPKSRIRAWIDPLLKDEFPVDCAVKAAKLAKGCVDPVPSKRPDMSQVSMTLLQIQMSSNLWNDKMKATKDLLTSALHAR